MRGNQSKRRCARPHVHGGILGDIIGGLIDIASPTPKEDPDRGTGKDNDPPAPEPESKD